MRFGHRVSRHRVRCQQTAHRARSRRKARCVPRSLNLIVLEVPAEIRKDTSLKMRQFCWVDDETEEAIAKTLVRETFSSLAPTSFPLPVSSQAGGRQFDAGHSLHLFFL